MSAKGHGARRWLIVLSAVAIYGWASQEAVRVWIVDGEWNTAQKDRITLANSGNMTPADWAPVWERLQRAEALQPRSASVQELMGVVASLSPGGYSRQEEAVRRFRRAVALRPVSPNTWANLASALYAVGATGEEFEAALRNAAQVGPSMPKAQALVGYYGLAVFDEVKPETRRAIEQMVAAGVRRKPEEMLEIARTRGRLDVACRYLPETRRKVDAKWKELCVS